MSKTGPQMSTKEKNKGAVTSRDGTGGHIVQRSTANPASLLQTKSKDPSLTHEWYQTSGTQTNITEQSQSFTPMGRWRHETAEKAPWNNVKAFAALSVQDLEPERGGAVQRQKHKSWSTQNNNGSAYEWR